MIKLSRLWLWWGPDFYRRMNKRWSWQLQVILFPRPDVTAEGFLIAGWHLDFSMDAIDFDFRIFRVPPTARLA